MDCESHPQIKINFYYEFKNSQKDELHLRVHDISVLSSSCIYSFSHIASVFYGFHS